MKTETTKTTAWQRIEAVVNISDMSVNAFARHIGLARGENLYQIKRGNNGVSLDVADRIVARFPQIDKLWLLTGDGQMLKVDHRARAINAYCRGCQISPCLIIDGADCDGINRFIKAYDNE